jgi:ferredoxin
MRDFRYLEGVTTLEFTPETCVGCGQCATVCPHGVMAMADGKARVADRDACMECGACATNCPTAAVRVTPGVGCAALIVKRWLRAAGLPVDASCC